MSHGEPRASRAPWFAAVVLAVALWPLVHPLVVAELDSDPWKLGGFAMYTSYQTTLVVLFEPMPQGLRVLPDENLSAGVRRARQEFRARRNSLGRGVRPDDLARRVYAEHPEWERLAVVVQRLWLDPETARIDSEKTTFLYEAGEPLR